jgi:segregation and condensation protein A
MDNTSSTGFSNESIGFNVQLRDFSGPMDLLLHLVHQKEIPIIEVDMCELCSQYLEVISNTKLLDIEIAAEYLVIAATLLAMKSETLLPPSLAEEGSQQMYDPNFFENLRERLIAYERTKAQATSLLQIPQFGLNTFGRGSKEERMVTNEWEQDNFTGDIMHLGGMFVNLLKRVGGGAKSLLVRLEAVSIVQYMVKVVDQLNTKSHLSFSSMVSLLKEQSKEKTQEKDRSTRQGLVIGTFLAMLELVKRGTIQATQTADDISISLSSNVAQTDLSNFNSEFDEVMELAA